MNNFKERSGRLTLWKLVSGILSIVIAAVRVFQFGNLASMILSGYEMSDTYVYLYGFIAVIFMLIAGTVSIVTRNSNGIKSDVAIGILYFVSAFFHTLGGLSDVYIVLCIWSIICACLALISMILKGNNNKNRNQQS